MAEDDTRLKPASRRKVLLEASRVGGAVLLSLLSGWAGAWFQGRSEERHDLSFSAIKSGNASLGSHPVPSGDPFVDAIAGPEMVRDTPDPNGFYSYTNILRNDGDFPETDITLRIEYATDDSTALAGPSASSLDASSSILYESLAGEQVIVVDRQAAQWRIPRLNPGEWVSFSTDWKVPVEIEVVARSEDVSASDRV